MSDQDPTPDVAASALQGAEEVAPATRGRSTADRIRARRAERSANGGRELELILPEGEIVAFYRPLQLREIRDSVKGRGPLFSNIQLLLQACKRIELRDPASGEQTPAAQETEQPDVPVGFDERLADLLGLQGNTPEQILISAFEANDRAILSHAQRLDAWSSGEDLDTTRTQEVEDLLGEANAATST